MSCHAILKNLYGPKMDVNLTISFKITDSGNRDKKTYVLPPTSLTRCIGFVKHMLFCSFVAMKCVDIVFSLSIARLMRLDHTERICWRKFHG